MQEYGFRSKDVHNGGSKGARRNEVRIALQCVINQWMFVLNVLEGYHALELDTNNAKEAGVYI